MQLTTDTSYPIASQILQIEENLSLSLQDLSFGSAVFHVYNPLNYAFNPHSNFLNKYALGQKKILFLGMNPGPFGMAQNGVPFGDTEFVRDWLGITGTVCPPDYAHPKRPIQGLSCTRNEVSGSRFWGLMKSTCVTPECFFQNCFVHNYCPLMFMSQRGSNIIPSKIPLNKRRLLHDLCDEALRQVIRVLGCEIIVAIGVYAEDRVNRALRNNPDLAHIQINRILHPSPASPQANLGWRTRAEEQLRNCGVWEFLQPPYSLTSALVCR